MSTSLVLKNVPLREQFDVEHFDTSDHRPVSTIGAWDLINIGLGVRHALSLASRLRGSRGLLYLPLSQNRGGFARDAILIHLAKLFRWDVAAHLRGSELPETLYARQPRVVRALVRRTLRSVDSVGVMGPSLTGLFDGLVAREKIAVVPNGTPDPGFRAAVGSKGVLFLSNLRVRKGVREAADAADLVLNAEPDARFVFAGEPRSPELDAELRARLAGHGERVRIIGRVDGAQKRRLIEDNAILLFPPIEPEGHPRVVLEAMAAGMPVVTTDQGAIRDTICDGKHGFVLRKAVPEHLAQRLLTLLRDDSLRREMGEAARNHYLAHFTEEHAAAWLAAWLEDVYRRNRSSS